MKNFLQQFDSRTLLNIGLFAFLILLVIMALLDSDKDKDPTKLNLTDLRQSDIREITLKRLNEPEIKLERRNKIWYMAIPYQLPANDFRAQSVSALVEAKSFLQYDVNALDLKKFKLDKPEISIVINDDVTLEIGGVDPVNNRRYVKVGDTLHLVSDNFYYQLSGKVTAYISYQIIPPDLKLNKLILQKFSLTLHDGDWRLEPEQKDVSADSINEFVNEWHHAQSLEISEYKGKAGKTDISMFIQGEEKPLEFSVQKRDDSTYLIRHDLKLRYKLSDETAEKLQNLQPSPAMRQQLQEQKQRRQATTPAEPEPAPEPENPQDSGDEGTAVDDKPIAPPTDQQ